MGRAPTDATRPGGQPASESPSSPSRGHRRSDAVPGPESCAPCGRVRGRCSATRTGSAAHSRGAGWSETCLDPFSRRGAGRGTGPEHAAQRVSQYRTVLYVYWTVPWGMEVSVQYSTSRRGRDAGREAPGEHDGTVHAPVCILIVRLPPACANRMGQTVNPGQHRESRPAPSGLESRPRLPICGPAWQAGDLREFGSHE